MARFGPVGNNLFALGPKNSGMPVRIFVLRKPSRVPCSPHRRKWFHIHTVPEQQCKKLSQVCVAGLTLKCDVQVSKFALNAFHARYCTKPIEERFFVTRRIISRPSEYQLHPRHFPLCSDKLCRVTTINGSVGARVVHLNSDSLLRPAVSPHHASSPGLRPSTSKSYCG